MATQYATPQRLLEREEDIDDFHDVRWHSAQSVWDVVERDDVGDDLSWEALRAFVCTQKPVLFDPILDKRNQDYHVRKTDSYIVHAASSDPVGAILIFSDTFNRQSIQELRDVFETLYDAWSKDTRASSSATKILSHWAYQRAIGMGEPVIGLILEKVSRGSFHWCWALSEITGIDPAHKADSLKEAAEAWIIWGRENGYLAA